MRDRIRILLALLLSAMLAAGCTDTSPEKHLATAKEYLQKKDTKAAVIEIKNALQKNPDLGEARYLLGATLLEQGDPVAAEVELRKALAAKYSNDLVVPDLARAVLMLGQAKKVVDEFGKDRFDKPAAQANLQTSLAAAYAALDKPDLAKAALGNALAADPSYAPAQLADARQKAMTRDFDGALRITEAVIAKEPGNVDAWKLKGDILVVAFQKPDQAAAAYRKAVASNASYLPAHYALLTTLLQQGKLDDAGAQVELLKKIAAKRPQTIYFEAVLAYYRKDFKLARQLSQQLLQQAPNDSRLLLFAGAVELQLAALNQAEAYLTAARQIDPALALAQRLLIVTYLRSGQPAKALGLLRDASSKGDVGPEMYSLAGEVFLQSGDAKQAEEYFAKALRHDPGSAQTRTALAIAQLADGQTAEAFNELQNIAASDANTTADLALISMYLRRNEPDKALHAVDKLEKKLPNQPIAANLRGRIQLAQKDDVAARKSFERALAIDPNFFAAAASLAAMDFAEKRPEEAKKRFEAMLAKNPKNEQALLALARLAAHRGAQKGEIADLLGKAIDASPTDVAPRRMLIELYVHNRDYKQALASAQSAAAAVPASPELLAELGRVQQLSGDVNQAIATYTKLVLMQPQSPAAYVRLAEAHMVNKDKKAAEQNLRKALQIKPDFLDAQRGLILLDVEAKMYPDAIKLARQVQEQRPDLGLGLVLEGDINFARSDWAAAVAAYKAALQLAPVSDSAAKLHAALVASGKASEAEQFASSWTSAHPADAKFALYLAAVALARKDYVAAEQRYVAVLRIQPDSPLALNNLAWVTMQLKKNGALAYAERANQLAPKQPQFMDTLALLLSANGEHARAIELETQATNLQPTNNALRLNLARIFIAAGDKARAREELDALVSKGYANADVIALRNAL